MYLETLMDFISSVLESCAIIKTRITEYMERVKVLERF